MSPEWIEIFRSYTPEELQAMVDKLKTQISVYSSQSVGSKTYAKDLGELKNQLQAAVRVQNERANQNTGTTGYVDFSQINNLGPLS